MSKEFIQQKVGSVFLEKARRQQSQLSYFTESSIQEDITEEYLKAWANRNYSGNDIFHTWIKNIFKTQNFLSFFKYHRFPSASAALVNDNIKPHLKRVFHSEDSFFKYTIKGESIEDPDNLDVKKFDEQIFNALLFNYNDIIVTDLKDVNKPFSHIVDINKVVAIESFESEIKRIAFQAEAVVLDENGVPENKIGFLFIDDREYILYDKDYNVVLQAPHDLGHCPADYISAESFTQEDPVRKSIFTYSRPDLEEYVFLKTLLKMTEPNGAIPIATILESRDRGNQGKDIKGLDGEPNIDNKMSSQNARFSKQVNGSNSSTHLQAGSVIEVPMFLKDGTTVDMDVVKNYINFFYTPIEALDYMNTRIKELKQSILDSVIGTISNQNKGTRNELDVQSGFVSAEDKLRSFSLQLSRIRKRTDFNKLALQYGRDNVSNEAFYGSDFFLQTDEQLYEMFKNAPNPIERRNTLIKLSKSRNKFNQDKSTRETIMYGLLPYISDADFTTAIESQLVSGEVFQLQNRFNYWINLFEAQFGDILEFWTSLGDMSNAKKLIIINNLLLGIIKGSGVLTQAILPQPKPDTGE